MHQTTSWGFISDQLEKCGLFTHTNKEILERFCYARNIHIMFQARFISTLVGGGDDFFPLVSRGKNDYLLYKGRIFTFKK